MRSQDPREQIAVACRVLAANGHSDLIWGHVSVRDSNGRGTWIKSAGLGFEEITPEDVILIDQKGTRLEGDGQVHLEYPIHTEVLAARPDVEAIVHTHAEAAVTFAATRLPLRPLGHEGTLFTPPDVARFVETGDLVRTPELGRAMTRALGERNTLLLVNHGLVTAGTDVASAVLAAVFLEKACRMQLTAASTGAAYMWSDDEEALAKRERCYAPSQLESAWSYLVRRLPENLPSK